MLLDQFVPKYQFREIHAITIRASAPKVLESARSIRPSDVPLVGFLMGLRSIPAALRGGECYKPGKNDAPFLDQVVGETGFLVLGEEPGKEFVLGIVGQFWKLTGNINHMILSPDQFLLFQEDGWAKAGWNFLVEQEGMTTHLVTETRIHVQGTWAKRRFWFYWLMIRPGSGLLRRTMLKAIKRKAESDNR